MEQRRGMNFWKVRLVQHITDQILNFLQFYESRQLNEKAEGFSKDKRSRLSKEASGGWRRHS